MRIFRLIGGTILCVAVIFPALLSFVLLCSTGLWRFHSNVPGSTVWREASYNFKGAARLVFGGRGAGEVNLAELYFGEGLILLWPVTLLVVTAFLWSPILWRMIVGWAAKAKVIPGVFAAAVFLTLWYAAFREMTLSDEERFLLMMLSCLPSFFLVYLMSFGVQLGNFSRAFEFGLRATVRCTLFCVGGLVALLFLVWILGYVVAAPVVALSEHGSHPALAAQIQGLPRPLPAVLRLAEEHLLPAIWVVTVNAYLLLQFLIVPSLSYGLTYAELHVED